MRIRSRRRVRLTALSFLALPLIIAGTSLAARKQLSSDPAALRRRQQVLAQRRAAALESLRHIKRRQHEISGRIAVLDLTLDKTQARLGAVKQDVQFARVNLAEAVQQYQAAEARLSDHREDVSDRLVTIYELGEVRPIEVLLQSTSFTDFANRLYLINLLVQSDAELLDRFEEARSEADRQRAAMAEREQALSHLQDRVEEEQQKVSEKLEATVKEKKRILADRWEWERQLAELEQASNEVTAMLERLQQTRAGRARLMTPWRGGLTSPVNGKVTSGYGYRTHPIFHVRKMHTGVDIAAPYGTAIHAAAGGVVVHAARWGGYGNCVIVDHGGGLATLYAHCSSLAVNVGDSVRQGQTIGYVGSTGLSIGPHLHFEVRRNGRTVDPMGF
jgi:murein DD-endopeptidase MepM/ murein hydrolase activator NlpD